MARSVLPLLLLATCLALGDCFLPTKNNKEAPTALAHTRITSQALRRVSRGFMNEFPDRYPNKGAVFASRDYKEAVAAFKNAASTPDVDPILAELDEAHFSGEKIEEGNQRLLTLRVKILTAISDDDMSGARDLTGQLLHTLQDFYSHSNWVENGNSDYNAALGDPARPHRIGAVATPAQTTCSDCDDVTFETCRDNILADIFSGGILTSGYVQMGGVGPATDHKPTGKCSHGGSGDITSDVSGTGGINKDTDVGSFSPHHYLHVEAARQAEDASARFLRELRKVRTDDEFAKFLGLSVSSSLCFVMDTTGSMSDDLKAAIATAIDITRNSASGSQKPSDYVLVPFNDPGFGPVFKTTEADAMVSALENITVAGGGDAPEMSFSGMILAIDSVRQGSKCFMFTDAQAKDVDLAPVAEAKVVANKVEMTIFYTGPMPARRRRRRNAERLLSRSKRATDTDPYASLVTVSGGQILYTTKSDLGDALELIDLSISPLQVTVVQRDELTAATPTDYVIPVDESLTDMAISLTCSSGQFTAVDILDGSGVVLTPGVADSGADVILRTDLTTVKLFTAATPAQGEWRVRVTATGTFSLRVIAKSVVDFNYRFVEKVDFGHGGYRVVDGKPLAGKEAVLWVQTFGAFNADTGAALDSGLAHVTELVLMQQDGTDIEALSLTELERLEEYEASRVPPSGGFRIALRGRDHSDNLIQRVDTTVWTTASAGVSVVLDASGSHQAAPGETLSVTVRVQNSGASADYTLTASNSAGFTSTVSPATLTLGTDDTQDATVTFDIPLTAPTGTVSTVSVIATSATSDKNFVVFRIAVVDDIVDITPPMCDVIHSEGSCDATRRNASVCKTDTWSITFSARDSGVGLYAVRPVERYLDAALTHEGFDIGSTEPISGTYTSDCCVPRVSLVASDVMGNAGVCSVDYSAPGEQATVRDPTVAVDPVQPPEEGGWSTALIAGVAGGVSVLVLALIIVGMVFAVKAAMRPNGVSPPRYTK